MGMFFDDEPLQRTPKAQRRPSHLQTYKFARPHRNIIPLEAVRGFNVGSDCVYDIELYPNYFLAGFKHLASQSYFFVEASPANNFFIDRDALGFIMWRFQLTGFNTKSYDLAIIEAALKGGDIQGLRAISNEIIFGKDRPFKTENPFNEIDLIEVAPLKGSLKLYGGRLHAQRIQELPIDPNVDLAPEDIPIVLDYNCNDLDVTELLKRELTPHLALREKLGAQYNKDFRSLSDAQIAERIITQEIENIAGSRPRKPGYESAQGLVFTYIAPSYVQFLTPELQAALLEIQQAAITVDLNGYAVCPPQIEGRDFIIGGRVYRMGLGGLHSQETCQAIVADADNYIKDIDVTGYYPNIILKNKFSSAHLGDVELIALQSIVDKRYAAKKAGDDVVASSLKIASNGEFGKKSDPFSIVYDPRAMVQTTLTGQLSLLMAIEYLTLRGFEVVSANTDGIITKVPKVRYGEFREIVTAWEAHTGLETEETNYKAVYSRDVNNYIAVKDDGKCKVKGVYSDKGSALNSPLSKNPEALICSEAVQAFLTKGTPIVEFVTNCQDITKFVCLRNVKGGAHKDGFYVGKVVRWYYAKGERGALYKVQTGDQVPKSIGAKPLMELTGIPADLDRDWYAREAIAILTRIGYYVSSKQEKLL